MGKKMNSGKIPYLRRTLSIFFVTFFILVFGFLTFIIYENYNKQKKGYISQKANDLKKIKQDFYENIILINNIEGLIENDFKLLDFITSDKKKSGKEYYFFKEYLLESYGRLLSTNNKFKSVQILVQNENIISIPPLIKVTNMLPRETLELIQEDENYVLKSVSEFEYYSKRISIIAETVFKNSEFSPKSNFSIVSLKNSRNKYFSLKNKTEGKNIEFLYLDELDIFILHNSNFKEYFNKFLSYSAYTICVAVILFFIFSIFINKSLKKVFTDIRKLLQAVEKVKNGENTEVLEKIDSKNELYDYYKEIDDISKKIRNLIGKAVVEERNLKDAELKALQSQINAHFLQNSLEAIKMIALIKEEYMISDSITDLGQLIRYGIEWEENFVSIHEEIEHISRYVNLYRLRLDYEIDLKIILGDNIENLLIPKLIIQPLVENSIEHGIKPAERDGEIFVEIKNQEGVIFISVFDNGIGFNLGKTVKDISKKKSSIGMKNIEDRLKRHFGNESKLKISTEEDKFTKIELEFRA